jgi:hypothetical protein
MRVLKTSADKQHAPRIKILARSPPTFKEKEDVIVCLNRVENAENRTEEM